MPSSSNPQSHHPPSTASLSSASDANESVSRRLLAVQQKLQLLLAAQNETQLAVASAGKATAAAEAAGVKANLKQTAGDIGETNSKVTFAKSCLRSRRDSHKTTSLSASLKEQDDEDQGDEGDIGEEEGSDFIQSSGISEEERHVQQWIRFQRRQKQRQQQQQHEQQQPKGSRESQLQAPRSNTMTNQFTDVIADFRRRATRDTRASALRASAFADETPFLRFQDAHVQHRQDHRQQQFQQRTRQPTGWRPGIQPVSAFSHPQSANSFAWPPPLLVDFGQLEISFTDWVTAGIELKEARRSEISLKYASDETRKSLSRQPHIVRSVAGDDTVVYIDNLCAQVPQLVRSTLRVGDELVTIGDVGAPKSIKFSPGTAVETIEEMVTQFAENDLELVFFRPLSRHIRRRLRHQRRHHSFNVPDIVPQAGNASAQARLADQAEDALHSSSSKTHHTDRGTANTETKARWPNNARRPESLNGVAASASKLEEDIYDRNNFISFAVRVELFSVTNLALATMNGAYKTELAIHVRSHLLCHCLISTHMHALYRFRSYEF